MKIYHFTMFFAVFAIGVIVLTDAGISKNRRYEKERLRMETIIDDAVNAAAWELRASGTVFDGMTEERVIDAFYYSLYASLGITGHPDKRAGVQQYIPVLMIRLNGGYYVYTFEAGKTGAPYENYHRSGFIPDGENGEISFTAFFAGYPMEYGTYDGYRASGAFIKERLFDTGSF